MESQLLLAIHQHASRALDVFFAVSHVVGGLEASIALVGMLALWHVARNERREALVWLVAGVWTLAALEVLKMGVGRHRPELWPRMVEEMGYSFPSGHALASATFYPLLAWDASSRRPTRARLYYLLAVLGALWIGLGRLYLGVHWPSDVAAGWTLGALQSVFAIARLNSRERPTPSQGSLPPP
jgi:undecaprenyl-diphosphatase